MLVFIVLIGFLIGFSVPVTASRFGKIMPADPGLLIATLWHRPRFPKTLNEEKRRRLCSKWKKMLLFSVVWGVVFAGLFGFSCLVFPFGRFVYAAIFLYFIAMLIAVDQQYFLLPDFFTIPLLLLGITQACFLPHVSMAEAVIGAWAGYVISVVAVLIMSMFKKAEFGGGDVKMLTALGAWFGFLGLNYVLLISSAIFAVSSFLSRSRSGAFGPALGVAAVLVFFYMYLK